METNSDSSSWRWKHEGRFCINSGLHARDAVFTNWVQFSITAIDRLVGEQERKVVANFLLVSTTKISGRSARLHNIILEGKAIVGTIESTPPSSRDQFQSVTEAKH